MNALIRRMTEKDLTFFVLNKGLMFEENATLASIKSSVIDRNDATFLVYEDTQIKGIIGCYISDDFADIATLYVTHDFRNKGIAKALLQALIEIFKSKSVKFVTLEVSEKNEPAINLYGSFGFKIIHTRPHYYKDGTNALVMEMEIQ